ncbi:phosphoglycolate phosphatase [Pelomonas sp. SE-A7]|uniref:phosphoglycolate phosphatase n=1 Tax=Pelomonas sp. SE-A7 TaxID=3054953 RepID=UPI00259CD4FA|nr:phosphoglycolate phosphatase [Pelomonas sp. SE-A7]MDM4765537.1 phosphoglycolate phosphatase [Pelomonas sp. SE-A7]
MRGGGLVEPPALEGVRAVLFDLDGTLVDSAPDLAGATNEMRIARGLPALPVDYLRPMVGAGARGMMGLAFQVTPQDASFPALKAEFFDRYEQRLLAETLPFDGVPEMLDVLAAAGLAWGIVTNKSERFALPLTAGLGLAARAAAVIGGDTTPHTKPHPAPLLEAAHRAGVAPEHCIYVGDDERDIQAGRAAGMRTVAVSWGYLGQGLSVSEWGADLLIDNPAELLAALGLA